MAMKTNKIYVEWAYGFPVYLLNVPMTRIRGVWTPDINYNKLETVLARALAFKPSRLIGNEVAFIRKYFGMNARIFADRFSVTHAAVLKWEKSGSKVTNMNWATEKDIRMFIVQRSSGDGNFLGKLYGRLEKEAPDKSSDIRVEVVGGRYRAAA